MTKRSLVRTIQGLSRQFWREATGCLEMKFSTSSSIVTMERTRNDINGSHKIESLVGARGCVCARLDNRGRAHWIVSIASGRRASGEGDAIALRKDAQRIEL